MKQVFGCDTSVGMLTAAHTRIDSARLRGQITLYTDPMDTLVSFETGYTTLWMW